MRELVLPDRCVSVFVEDYVFVFVLFPELSQLLDPLLLLLFLLVSHPLALHSSGTGPIAPSLHVSLDFRKAIFVLLLFLAFEKFFVLKG